MAKNKMVLGLALGGIVLLVLFLFTRDGMQPERKSRTAPQAKMVAVPKNVAKPNPEARKAERQKRKEAKQAKRREEMLKRWAGMTPEQRKVFMKKHPKFKPPVDAAAPATNTPTAAKPAATKATAQPATTTNQKTTTSTTTTKTQPAKTTTQQKAN